MNIERYFRWLLVSIILIAGTMIGIDSALASTEQKQQVDQKYQPDAATLINYGDLKKMETRWEAAIRTGGWVRHSYHQRIVEDDQVYRAPDAQFPSEATVEIWFHFNKGLVDQQITLITHNGQRIMTEILYRGIYRSMAEAFTPIEQEPYSPSLYFYITSESPEATAREGMQVLTINQDTTLMEGNDIARFSVRHVFPAGMPGYSEKDANIIGTMQTIYIDPITAQPLQIDNYFLLKDNGSRLFQEITQIEAERVVSLPEDVQWYFDNYDLTNWSSYSQLWSSQ
ncbi:MAG TPA: hypothetical protein VJ972_13555 [Anaerolineales bacterium]|nr:hypothetical protein [Anaerolineales bacterium]